MIKSMTGFGRCEVTEGNRKYTVEMKSVNHRYLDVNIKMPKSLNFFESTIRSLLKEYMERGKVDLYITFEDFSEDNYALKYNEELANYPQIVAGNKTDLATDEQRESFRKYIAKPGKNGENIAVINLDSENAVESAKNTGADIKYFSIKEKTDYYAENIDLSDGYGEFDIMKGESLLCHVKLSVPGIHNVANATAAAASADLCGIGAEAIKAGLEKFIGVKRRFEKIKTLDNGAIVIDDYAHHPDEITVTLNSAKKVAKGKVICIFQPHTFSRTKALFPDFVKALSIADKVLMAPIYPARETDTLGISSDDVANKIKDAESLYTFEELKARAEALSEKGDLVITMGAGDVYKVFQA